MKEQQRYIVRVKNGASWRQFPRLRLMISVGKLYHEGTKLQAVVEWINKNPTVTEVQVSVNDLLQRHNLIAYGAEDDFAAHVARMSGKAWVKRNEKILSDLLPKWSFTLWDEWYGSPEYHAAYNAIVGLVSEDANFREVVEIDSTSLAKRKEMRGEKVPDKLVVCSYEYVIEELAVFALQSKKLPAAEVYPGSSLQSVRYLLNRSLPNEIDALSTRYVTRIDFERRKNIISEECNSIASNHKKASDHDWMSISA